MFETTTRITRRRSSAGPIPLQRPQQPRPRPRETSGLREGGNGGQRPTFLTLRDHGKVYVADLPRLSDGQLSQIAREAEEVLESLNRRLEELRTQLTLSQVDQDTRIRATTKRDVTERFLSSIAQEQELRRSNPALRAAAGESLARAFLELARHRLPGATFDSLLEEALSACDPTDPEGRSPSSHDPQVIRLLQGNIPPAVRAETMPVVLTPDLPRDSAV